MSLTKTYFLDSRVVKASKSIESLKKLKDLFNLNELVGKVAPAFTDTDTIALSVIDAKSTTGVKTDKVLAKNGVVVTNATPVAANATATIVAATVASGYIKSTSAAATALTLPSASSIWTALGSAAVGATFDFVVDNSAGANTVTIVLPASISVITPEIIGSDVLTVSVANLVGVFRLVKGVAGTYILRIA